MSSIKQDAHGSNINQAGRDITVIAPQPIDADRLIPCPDCLNHVSRNANECRVCGFRVKDHYYALFLLEKEELNCRRGFYFLCVTLPLVLGYSIIKIDILLVRAACLALMVLFPTYQHFQCKSLKRQIDSLKTILRM